MKICGQKSHPLFVSFLEIKPSLGSVSSSEDLKACPHVTCVKNMRKLLNTSSKIVKRSSKKFGIEEISFLDNLT
jgi:hypothetical protein